MSTETTTPSSPAPVCEMTVEEMTESLTGFDEIAIERHMGIDPYADGERKPMMLLRSLVFVHQRRTGKDDKAAKASALEATVGDLYVYFTEDPADIDPDAAPDSTAGKDD